MDNLLKRQRLYSQWAMIVITLIWGTSFIITQKALKDIGPLWFIGLRFLIAFTFMNGICYKRIIKTPIATIEKACYIGLVLFASYMFQTIGLLYTTASNSGFITGLSVILVPILCLILQRVYPNKLTVIGVISSFIGLGLLTIKDNLTVNLGDFYTFLCALCLAAHIIMVGHFSPRIDCIQSTYVQIGTVAICGILGGVFFEKFPVNYSSELLFALILTAIPGTVLGFLVQNTAQRYITPTQTSIILMFEPVFAVLAAYFIADEQLAWQQIVGCLLIFTGMIISVISELHSPCQANKQVSPQ